ncbi:MAG: hypothetical protein NTX48_14085 [Planctomycetales bacterium]|nr:hypothetical protein [Planctomycetales bacterium]
MVSRKSVARILLATTTLTAMFAFACFTMRSWQWEPILHVFGMISEDEWVVKGDLQHFRQLVDRVIMSWDDTIIGDPPQQMAEYFAVDFPDKASTFGYGAGWVFKYLDKGVDPWGSNFIFKSELVRGEGKTGVLFLTVRSIGANRLDEDCKGDDIQKIMDFPCLLASALGDSELVRESKERSPSDKGSPGTRHFPED